MSRVICQIRQKRFINCLYEPIEKLEEVADELERDGQIVAAQKIDNVIDHLEGEREYGATLYHR